MQHTWLKTGGKMGSGESTPAELSMLADRFPEQSSFRGDVGGEWEQGIRAVGQSPDVLIETSGFERLRASLKWGLRTWGCRAHHLRQPFTISISWYRTGQNHRSGTQRSTTKTNSGREFPATAQKDSPPRTVTSLSDVAWVPSKGRRRGPACWRTAIRNVATSAELVELSCTRGS